MALWCGLGSKRSNSLHTLPTSFLNASAKVILGLVSWNLLVLKKKSGFTGAVDLAQVEAEKARATTLQESVACSP